MTKINTKTNYALALAILVLALALFTDKARQSLAALSVTQNSYHTVATSTAEVGTTIVQLVARNDTRVFTQCMNISAVDAYCAKIGTGYTFATSAGMLVKANGGNFVYDMNDPYMGPASCRTSNGTTTFACEQR